MPTAKHATTNVATWHETTSTDATTTRTTVPRGANAAPPRVSSRAMSRRTRRLHATTSAAAAQPARIASSTPSMALEYADTPRPVSTTAASTSCTACPAARSDTTAREASGMRASSAPWASARCTSPITPPGSTVLRNCDR